jgi:CBS domain-containing protein
MRAKELMVTGVFTVSEDETVERLMANLVTRNIHGAPVVDKAGKLVGFVTHLDIFLGSMSSGLGRLDEQLKVGEIMTSPAVSADEDTSLKSVCQVMHRLRIHRLPIVREGTVVGIVSSLDVCAAVSRGEDLVG